MTRDVLAVTPSYPINGVGPYPYNNPYTQGSLLAYVVIDGRLISLAPSEYIADPLSSNSLGGITLTTSTAATFDGGTLHIFRQTDVEQGFAGQSARENGLAAQLDWMTEAIQDMSHEVRRSLRSTSALLPGVLPPGFTVMIDDDGNLVAGPRAAEIALAQGFAIRAETAADRVDLGALDDAVESTSADAEQTALDREAAELAAEIAVSAYQSRSAVFIAFGQSNAQRGATKSSVAYPEGLKTFSPHGDVKVGVNTINNGFSLSPENLSSLVPYSENGLDTEGVAPGFAEASAYRKIITFTPAIGGNSYRQLRSGTGPWSNVKQTLKRGFTHLSNEEADKWLDLILTWDHGESEADTVAPGGGSSETPATQAQYLEVIQDLVLRWNKAVQVQTLAPERQGHIIGSNPCVVTGDSARGIQNAHLEAAQTIPNYYLFGPKYAYQYQSDGVHIDGPGKRLYWQYVALRWARFLAGRSGLPTHMTGATRSGVTVTVPFFTPDGSDLVIDTTVVPETTTSFANSKYGFEFDDGGTLIAVSDVTVSGKTATLTLASAPTSGGTEKVRLGQMLWPGGNQVVSGTASKLARSNIRSSTVYTYGVNNHFDWAAQQNVEVS